MTTVKAIQQCVLNVTVVLTVIVVVSVMAGFIILATIHHDDDLHHHPHHHHDDDHHHYHHVSTSHCSELKSHDVLRTGKIHFRLMFRPGRSKSASMPRMHVPYTEMRRQSSPVMTSAKSCNALQG